MIRALLLGLLLALPVAYPALSQLALPGGNEGADTSITVPVDPLGRSTPRGMADGLITAISTGDTARAQQFFDMGSRNPERTAAAVEAFQLVLDRSGGLLPSYQLSNDPSGTAGDGLAPEEDRFAIVRTSTGLEDLIAVRVEAADGVMIWRVAPRSLNLIERRARVIGTSVVEQWTPAVLEGRSVFAAPTAHWIAVVLMAAVAALVARLVTTGILFTLTLMIPRMRDEHTHHIANAIRLPISVLLGLTLFNLGIFVAGVSIVLRSMLAPALEVAGWFLLGWLVWRLVDATARAGLNVMSRRGQAGAVSVMTLVRRAAKIVVVVVAMILIAGSLGVDLTGWLAALGIGGLAFALGAQKTIEHLVGSLSIISDQPIRVGDFCQVDGLFGTVEDIGMRSTRLRTLDRTLITIPNGTMSQARIENYASRDRFKFSPTLTLVYETSPDQMRALLWRLNGLLEGDTRIVQDGARVRFKAFGASSLDVEIMSYVIAEDYPAFLAIQEELNLSIMEIVSDCGSAFAFPTRTVHLKDHRSNDVIGFVAVA